MTASVPIGQSTRANGHRSPMSNLSVSLDSAFKSEMAGSMEIENLAERMFQSRDSWVPDVIVQWLEKKLDDLGIDSNIYTRAIINQVCTSAADDSADRAVEDSEESRKAAAIALFHGSSISPDCRDELVKTVNQLYSQLAQHLNELRRSAAAMKSNNWVSSGQVSGPIRSGETLPVVSQHHRERRHSSEDSGFECYYAQFPALPGTASSADTSRSSSSLSAGGAPRSQNSSRSHTPMESSGTNGNGSGSNVDKDGSPPNGSPLSTSPVKVGLPSEAQLSGATKPLTTSSAAAASAISFAAAASSNSDQTSTGQYAPGDPASCLDWGTTLKQFEFSLEEAEQSANSFNLSSFLSCHRVKQNNYVPECIQMARSGNGTGPNSAFGSPGTGPKSLSTVTEVAEEDGHLAAGRPAASSVAASAPTAGSAFSGAHLSATAPSFVPSRGGPPPGFSSKPSVPSVTVSQTTSAAVPAAASSRPPRKGGFIGNSLAELEQVVSERERASTSNQLLGKLTAMEETSSYSKPHEKQWQPTREQADVQQRVVSAGPVAGGQPVRAAVKPMLAPLAQTSSVQQAAIVPNSPLSPLLSPLLSPTGSNRGKPVPIGGGPTSANCKPEFCVPKLKASNPTLMPARCAVDRFLVEQRQLVSPSNGGVGSGGDLIADAPSFPIRFDMSGAATDHGNAGWHDEDARTEATLCSSASERTLTEADGAGSAPVRAHHDDADEDIVSSIMKNTFWLSDNESGASSRCDSPFFASRIGGSGANSTATSLKARLEQAGGSSSASAVWGCTKQPAVVSSTVVLSSSTPSASSLSASALSSSSSVANTNSTNVVWSTAVAQAASAGHGDQPTTGDHNSSKVNQWSLGTHDFTPTILDGQSSQPHQLSDIMASPADLLDAADMAIADSSGGVQPSVYMGKWTKYRYEAPQPTTDVSELGLNMPGVDLSGPLTGQELALLHQELINAGLTSHGGNYRPSYLKPCTFLLERGFCKKEDCKFAHNLKQLTCKFWLTGECLKAESCPFLHGYPTAQPTPNSQVQRNQTQVLARSVYHRERHTSNKTALANAVVSALASLNPNDPATATQAVLQSALQAARSVAAARQRTTSTSSDLSTGSGGAAAAPLVSHNNSTAASQLLPEQLEPMLRAIRSTRWVVSGSGDSPTSLNQATSPGDYVDPFAAIWANSSAGQS